MSIIITSINIITINVTIIINGGGNGGCYSDCSGNGSQNNGGSHSGSGHSCGGHSGGGGGE
jgi:hypothetical protein